MNLPKKVLIVEDEPDIQELIRFNLSQSGFETECVESTELASVEMQKFHPDLILLDIMLPGTSGIEFCSWLRKSDKYNSIPIIMLTALDSEKDIINGLDAGADDYIPKPFSPNILISRIKALLRRTSKSQKSFQLKYGLLEMDTESHRVELGQSEVKLTVSEFSILKAFMSRPGRVYTRQQLIDLIRGEDYAVTDRTIDFQMVGLRRKLGSLGQSIETVRGIGYRLKGEP